MIQSTFEETNEDYKAFVEKFKPKKTTDDCYTPAIVTAAGINYLAVHHTPFKVRREEAVFIRKMDAQDGSDKAIFGGGFLLTEEAARRRAAAERAAAERAAATVWQLSAREIAMQKLMIRK